MNTNTGHIYFDRCFELDKGIIQFKNIRQINVCHIPFTFPTEKFPFFKTVCIVHPHLGLSIPVDTLEQVLITRTL
jgi:hypothetical protein